MKTDPLSDTEIRILRHLSDNSLKDEKYNFINLFDEWLSIFNTDESYPERISEVLMFYDEYFTEDVIWELNNVAKWTKISESQYQNFKGKSVRFEAVAWE